MVRAGDALLTLKHGRKRRITRKEQVKWLRQEETRELVCRRKITETMKGEPQAVLTFHRVKYEVPASRRQENKKKEGGVKKATEGSTDILEKRGKHGQLGPKPSSHLSRKNPEFCSILSLLSCQ